MSEPRSDATSPRPPALPEGRYDGVDERSGFMGKVVAGFLVALVLALLVAGGFTIYRLNATPSITSEVIGVEVIDEQSMRMSMTVTRDDPGEAAYCIVRAQDQSKGELGRREVYVPPSDNGTVQVDAEIATTGRAYMGDVYGCGNDIPDYLRR
ncbi:DUF4307 domain-containing protein [Dietzia aurantiaca]|uniref:DUF4307 domain-containing protein n=1 Tax=Dietzia aurantiaca TaxID=983873 RepID=UPI001E5BC085|nr:DUF4307 domain-containing protein [Dietzia aurantiaca]MCD2263611.1 DUF4307 domain-containing protein [Dietzia aurantiaca]